MRCTFFELLAELRISGFAFAAWHLGGGILVIESQTDVCIGDVLWTLYLLRHGLGHFYIRVTCNASMTWLA